MMSPSSSSTPAQDAWHYHTERLRPEILRDAVASAVVKLAEEVFREFRREIARLKAELDEHGSARVLLCPSVNMLKAMDESLGEEDGTIMRATDYPDLEYEMRAGQWVKRLDAPAAAAVRVTRRLPTTQTR